jgi:hypothetical protein
MAVTFNPKVNMNKLVTAFLAYVDDNQTRRLSADVLVDEFSKGWNLGYQMQINLRTALWERGII